jgi:beta-glucanase (GH16 family)
MQKSWVLVWQDNFDQKEIDRTLWRFDTGYTGESNQERQIYTNRRENVRIEWNCLVIEARKEEYESFQYTSARLTTAGMHSWTYGRIEARIQIPRGQGIWPAFWMLGDDRFTEGWPHCGEIDIMESIGSNLNTVRGTLHGPGYCRDDSIGMDYSNPQINFADDFHVYSIEWEPNLIRFYVDQHHYNTLTPHDLPSKWVFDHPFHILLNVAVGGIWPGYPDETTVFPQLMKVDYVRVYSRKDKSDDK